MDNRDYWTNKVNFDSHCAICLQVFGGTLKPPSECPDLGTIWKCLPVQLRRQKILPREYVFLHEGNQELESPQLCDPCCENVTTLDNLKKQLTEIKKKIERQEKRFQETLARSKERQSRLTRTLRSMYGGNLDPEIKCFENTVRFIQMIHGTEVVKISCQSPTSAPKPTEGDDDDDVKILEAEVKIETMEDNDSIWRHDDEEGNDDIPRRPNGTRNFNESESDSNSEEKEENECEGGAKFMEANLEDETAQHQKKTVAVMGNSKSKNDLQTETENLKNKSNSLLDGDNDDELSDPEAMDFNDDEDVKLGEIPVKIEDKVVDEDGGDEEYFPTMEPTSPPSSESDRNSVNDDEQNESSDENVTRKRKRKTAKTKAVTRRKKKPPSKSKAKSAESGPKAPKMFCQVCREKYPTNQLLPHMQSHVGDYATKCPNPECFHVFVSQVHLERIHLRVSLDKKLSQCRKIAAFDSNANKMCPVENCDFQCAHSIAFRTHLKRHETLEKNFTCPMKDCCEQFTIRRSVEYHLMDAHTHVRDYVRRRKEEPNLLTMKCDQCNTWNIPVDQIIDHLRTIHQVPADDIISCQSCPRKYSQRLRFIDHVIGSHRGQTFTCDICHQDDLSFSGPTTLREHYFVEHGVGTKVQCGECTYTSFSKSLLKKHSETMHKTNSSQMKSVSFKCDVCGEGFHEKARLTWHLIKEHGHERLPCRFCEKTFPHPHTRRQHEKLEHLGGRPREKKVCPECGKVFNRNDYLRQHVRTKHQNIQLKCDQCDLTFSYAKNLKQHQINVHGDGTCVEGRVFMCEECGRVFKCQTNLTEHRFIHSGEKPYNCEICGSTFRQTSVFRKHKKLHATRGNNFKVKKTDDDLSLDEKSIQSKRKTK